MFKTWLKKILIIVLELAVIFGGLYYVAQKKGIHTISEIAPALEKAVQQKSASEIPFPVLAQPAVKTFAWEYKGVKYSLDETLYQSIYKYYQTQPKEYSYVGNPPANWEQEYYAMFLKDNGTDKTIADLAAQIQALGKKHNLSDDQIVDLTLAFVQSIPYDDAKAKNILANTGDATMRFPYEVLWEQLGVCSDKSLLAYSMLKSMGYGVALFAFEQDNHMAVAVQCPQNYSTYASGYCYAETTSIGNKIGIIPSFDAQSNKTVATAKLSTYDPNQREQINLQELGSVTILLPIQGNQYGGIIQTQQITNGIAALKNSMTKLLLQIKTQKKTINQESDDLDGLKSDMDGYKKDNNIDKYNALVEEYNSLLKTYQQDVKKYNNNVTLYNQDVQKYNTLIKQ